LLAGRKLLLADDSVTIQKVIELTFADEGVRVVAFSDGAAAIDRLEEEAPDIVLADVFMPLKGGYEVCEYVKHNEKLKHIPVMLLVGSFEPFDEAEARRVGADDILTKPFQSIRRLIERVGGLVSSPPPVDAEVPTAELPKTEDHVEENGRLNPEELEISTADTMPLPEELKATLEIPQSSVSTQNTQNQMERPVAEVIEAEPADALLDLDELEPAGAFADDEFVLDLDEPEFDNAIAVRQEPEPARAFVEPEVTEAVAAVGAHGFSYQPEVQAPSYSEAEEIAYEDQVHEVTSEPVQTAEPVVSQASNVVPGELSQEMIDAIARRAVEMMSDKVIREIAWEVVPDLAELLIKRKLEESQIK
jgi:CheY-like chemotaxis protein